MATDNIKQISRNAIRIYDELTTQLRNVETLAHLIAAASIDCIQLEQFKRAGFMQMDLMDDVNSLLNEYCSTVREV